MELNMLSESIKTLNKEQENEKIKRYINVVFSSLKLSKYCEILFYPNLSDPAIERLINAVLSEKSIDEWREIFKGMFVAVRDMQDVADGIEKEINKRYEIFSEYY
jgi:hypothetical protein